MKLFFDLRLGYLVDSPGVVSPLESLEFKAGDGDEIILQFGRSAETTTGLSVINAPTWTAETLPANALITVGIKAEDNYSDGDLLASETSYTLDAGEKTYTFELDFNTTEIDALLERGDANDGNDVASLTNCNFEVTFKTGASAKPRSSIKPVSATIYHDVIYGNEGTPTNAGDPDAYALIENTIVYLKDVVGLTGGGATKLDGVETTSLSAGYAVAFHDDDSSSVFRVYELTAATTAESSPDVIRPDDYAATTNEKVWNLRNGGSAGETNTASNVGTAGVGVFKQKTGVDFEFKKINAGSAKVTITDDTGDDEVDIDVDLSEIKLDDLAAPDDNTDLNVSTSAHGLCPKLSNVATEFLNGQGSFSTPAGGGSSTALFVIPSESGAFSGGNVGTGKTMSYHFYAGPDGTKTDLFDYSGDDPATNLDDFQTLAELKTLIEGAIDSGTVTLTFDDTRDYLFMEFSEPPEVSSVRILSIGETNFGTYGNIGGGGSVSSLPDAGISTRGILETATQSEVNAGTATDKIVTPSTLANYTGLGGVLVQKKQAVSAARNSTSATFPLDDTVPQSSEGAEFTELAVTITGTSTSNVFRATAFLHLGNSTSGAHLNAGIWLDSEASCRGFGWDASTNLARVANVFVTVSEFTVPDLSSHTFKVRYGSNTGTTYTNTTGTNYYGSTVRSWLVVEEIA